MTKILNNEHPTETPRPSLNEHRGLEERESLSLMRQMNILLDSHKNQESSTKATYLDFTHRCLDATCSFLRERLELKDSQPLTLLGTPIEDLAVSINQTTRSLFILLYASKEARSAGQPPVLTSCVEAIRPPHATEEPQQTWMLTAVLCQDGRCTDLSINKLVNTQLQAPTDRRSIVWATPK